MITFGSRGSDLALYQSRLVAKMLQDATGVTCQIEVIETKGDRIIDKPLPEIGGKGLFTAELEEALRQGSIDVAVHSMKDLPVEDPDGLTLGAVPERVNPADVLIYDPAWADPAQPDLPLRHGCVIGTSSHRRRGALERVRPDLEFRDIRGNVPTRVDKVRRGDYGAAVFAAAGLDRLELSLDGLLRFDLPVSLCTPAPSQGALAVQCRDDDQRVLELLGKLHDPAAALCADTERDVLQRLGGGCSMPLGVLVTGSQKHYRLQAAFYSNSEYGTDRAAGLFLDLAGETPQQLAEHVAAQWQPLINAPLRGRQVVLLRPEGHGSDLEAALAIAGAQTRNVPLTRTTPIEGVRFDAADLEDRALAFTSARAVELFCKAVADDNHKDLTVFAGGTATAAAARRYGMTVTCPEHGSGGKALAELLLASGIPAAGVLFPCAAERHADLEHSLRNAGHKVTAVPVYKTEPLPKVELTTTPETIVVFTSPSAVRAYLLASRTEALHVAIGPSTAAAMQEASLRCDAVAQTPTGNALVDCCLQIGHARRRHE